MKIQVKRSSKDNESNDLLTKDDNAVVLEIGAAAFRYKKVD